MATTITPYDELGGLTTGGTWTRISASGPAAPAVYNDPLDFTGQPNGAYIYRYTVTSGSTTHKADVTINWTGTLAAPYNNVCTGARPLGVPGVVPFIVENNIPFYNDEQCELGYEAPTDSLVAKPASWGAGPFGGEDTWYILYVPAHTSTYSVGVTVDGSAYGSEGVYQPCLQIYTGLVTDTCSSYSLAHSTSVGTDQSVTGFVVMGPTAGLIWVRVVSYTAGKFDITIEANG